MTTPGDPGGSKSGVPLACGLETVNLNEKERALMTAQTTFKLPVSGVPLILIHQSNAAQRDEVSTSSTNAEQTNTAMRVIRLLRRAMPDASIRCICFYTAQRVELAALVERESVGGVVVTTADATQGHEAELAVVVTTCSVLDRDAATEPFWAQAARVDVALSRARHGMVVIGDLLLLDQTETWRRYLAQATRETMVVGPDYLNLETIGDAEHQYDQEGRLVDGRGVLVRSEDFYRLYGKGDGYNTGGFRRGANRYQPYLPQGGGRGRGGGGRGMMRR
uniref:DNA2/NAM7 helicase-like C-terminal domain-containing protein n=1 Tax=Globodera rostochiensis TaxID=31243 RepID=A0A914I9D6_GLORO